MRPPGGLDVTANERQYYLVTAEIQVGLLRLRGNFAVRDPTVPSGEVIGR
jgi:hypothetical protein